MTGTRSEGQQWIPDRSLDRRAPTFAQIYVAVRDAEFDSIFDGDLTGLDVGELRTLDSVCARQVELYRELARQQKADPDFEPPEGIPDMVFRNAAIEMRTFRQGRLAKALQRAERRHKAPELLEPWARLVWDRYDEPFGVAFELALPAVRMAVQAEVNGQAYEFSRDGVARYGYLDYAGARDLVDAAYPEDLTPEEAPTYIQTQALATMTDRGSILPAQIATAYLTAGSGQVEEPADFLKVIATIRNDMLRAMEHIQQQRVGTAPFIEERAAPPANLVYAELQRRAALGGNVYEPFADYMAQGNEDPLSGWLRQGREALTQ